MWVSVHCEGNLFQMARMSCESSSCTTKETCLQGIHNLNHSGVESFCCKKKTAIFFLNTILFPPPSFSFKERQWCPNSGRLSTCPWFIYANLRNGFSHVFHRSVWMEATGPPFFRVGEKGSERWWIVVYSNPLRKKKGSWDSFGYRGRSRESQRQSENNASMFKLDTKPVSTQTWALCPYLVCSFVFYRMRHLSALRAAETQQRMESFQVALMFKLSCTNLAGKLMFYNIVPQNPSYHS